MKRNLLLLAAFFFLSFQSARALDIAAIAAMNLSNASIEQPEGTSVPASSGTGIGLGVQIGLSIFPAFQFQPGAMYLNHRYTLGTTERSITGVQIPLLFRFTGLPLISIGAGPYFSFYSGEFADRNLAVPGSAPTTSTFAASDYDTTDWGMMLAVGAEFEVAPITYLVVDLRYFGSGRDINRSPTNSIRLKGILLVAGVKVGL